MHRMKMFLHLAKKQSVDFFFKNMKQHYVKDDLHIADWRILSSYAVF